MYFVVMTFSFRYLEQISGLGRAHFLAVQKAYESLLSPQQSQVVEGYSWGYWRYLP